MIRNANRLKGFGKRELFGMPERRDGNPNKYDKRELFGMPERRDGNP
jgi:hypothetical protein